MTSPTEHRAQCTDAIVSSTNQKKLIVAGPGTGKTFTFKQALAASGGRGLALTFINNLVRDLKSELEDVADAYTFHGFCKYRFHHSKTEGLTSHFNYYPPVMSLIAQDMQYTGRPSINEQEIERCLHNLDNTKGTLDEILRAGNYYDTVGHTDSVYRMLRHWEDNPNEIPEYPLVVVDEYQDFSLLETKFINLLAKKNKVLIAGDDDQALYGFKHASANYIRALAGDSAFEKFELPYCSRCTEVIINSVHDVIAKAQSQGLLLHRLSKPYLFFAPDKAEDSKYHPQIKYAYCTVERANAPYIGRYVSSCISEIPEEEIQSSKKGGYPTALVIGPVEFVRRVHEVLVKQFPNAILKSSGNTEISINDGYRYLRNNPDSRLGWRIVLHNKPCENLTSVIVGTYNTGKELSENIPVNYKERHVKVLQLIDKLINGNSLEEGEVQALESTTGLTLDTIKQAFTSPPESSGVTEDDMHDTSEPTIVCTSLLGAKGLSANRVFIVGFNNGHFPRNANNITEEEVCCFLVGLSRTRKQCYLVSCERFGNNPLSPSTFFKWIRTHCTTERVDKEWFQLRIK